MVQESDKARLTNGEIVSYSFPIGIAIAIGLYAGSEWWIWVIVAAVAFSVGHIALRSTHYKSFRAKLNGQGSISGYLALSLLWEGTKMGLNAFITLMIAPVASCGQQWTPEEKGNAQHFLNSLNLVIEAHSTSNKGVPGVIPRQEFERIFSSYQRALSEAKLVRDDVLEKIHPELKNNYRMYFQKGAELRVSGW